MKSAGKARSNGLYRHIRTSKEIIRNLLNDYDETYNLINIADFNSLIAQSQSNNTPVFLLTQEQVQKSGSVWENMKKNIEDFNQAFDCLANRVINATK